MSSRMRMVLAAGVVASLGVAWNAAWASPEGWGFWLQPVFGLLAGLMVWRLLSADSAGEEMRPGHGLLAAILVGGTLIYPLLAGNIPQRWDSPKNENPADAAQAEALVSIATDVALERADAGQSLDWPLGQTVEYAAREADFPPDVWNEAETRWRAMNAPQRQALLELREQLAEEHRPTVVVAASQGLGARLAWIVVAMCGAFLSACRIFAW